MVDRADHTLLVLRAQSGDREALDALLCQVQRPLFRCRQGIVGQRELAEDVLQEVFLILCRELAWLREPRLDLNGIRRAALDRMDESRRHAKGLLIAAATVEGLMAVAVLYVTDFGDRTQLLIFLCACLVYAPLALGLFTLRAFIDQSVERIVKAIEVIGSAGVES